MMERWVVVQFIYFLLDILWTSSVIACFLLYYNVHPVLLILNEQYQTLDLQYGQRIVPYTIKQAVQDDAIFRAVFKTKFEIQDQGSNYMKQMKMNRK